MKNFFEWAARLNEMNYDQKLDGPPLMPHHISGAENQIRTLARNLRTTFNLDPEFQAHHEQIFKAAQLLDQAADIIGDTMLGDQAHFRGKTHKFYK